MMSRPVKKDKNKDYDDDEVESDEKSEEQPMKVLATKAAIRLPDRKISDMAYHNPIRSTPTLFPSYNLATIDQNNEISPQRKQVMMS